MRIYNYNSISGEFTGESIARENPLEKGEYLIPANSTTVAPPSDKVGFYTVFSDSKWKQIQPPVPKPIWVKLGINEA